MEHRKRGDTRACWVMLASSVLAGCSTSSGGERKAPEGAVGSGKGTAATARAPAAATDDWRPLLGGKGMEGWETSAFVGHGEPRMEDGKLILPSGGPMTGVRYTREFPKMSYEIRLEAMRVEGSDFFCGLTFPVGDSHASLIVGGWGGGVCGVSSFNGRDASENETASYREFEKGKWYRIRLRVTEGAIEAWIDDEQIVDAETTGRRVDIRPDIAPSKPLGLSSYRTTAAIRGLEWREVPKEG